MSNSSKALVKPRHADLAVEWARQYAAGELQAGWWEWQCRGDSSGVWQSIGSCKAFSPNFYIATQYSYFKTDKHPQYDKHTKVKAEWEKVEVKAEWEKVKSKGTHEIWVQSERNGEWHCCGQGALFDSPGPYEIRKIKPKQLLDIRKLPKYAAVSHIFTPEEEELVLNSSLESTNVVCLQTRCNDVEWHYFQNLRLREQKDWQLHVGNLCPVPEGVDVVVTLRDGFITKEPAHAVELNWNYTGEHYDIIAYRIVRLAEGWTDDRNLA